MCANVVKLPHVVQKGDWDCGIACVEMILRYMRQEFDEELLYSLGNTLGFGTSVWTIDLMNILVYFKMDSVFYTITCGVDPGYRNQEYYQTILEVDEVRVNKLFENAKELGLNIVRGSVSLKEIFSKLDQGWIAIVLIDSVKLRCLSCELASYPWYASNILTWDLPSGNHYKGHYILLCGYDLGQERIFYKNPSIHEPLCCAKISVFESSRHSYGTDDDIIFVDLHLCETKTSGNSTN